MLQSMMIVIILLYTSLSNLKSSVCVDIDGNEISAEEWAGKRRKLFGI